MNFRSLLMAGAVSVALAGISGCGPDVEETAVAPPVEPVAPPVAAPEPVVPPAAAPEAVVVPPPVAGAPAPVEPGVAGPVDRPAGVVIDEAALTAKVKAALMAEQGVDGTRINVDAENGRVVLKGEVPDKTMIERAVRIARGIEGVRDVDNQLIAAGA